MKEINCHTCNKKFYKPIKEITRQLKKGRSFFFCSHSCAAKHHNKSFNKNYQNYPLDKQCPKCKKIFTVDCHENERMFCSKHCSNSRKPLASTRAKISEGNRRDWAKNYEIRLRQSIINSNQANSHKLFSSKGEREIVKYFKENFTEGDWTSGGGVIYKNSGISRDLYSNNLKTCIEYDGVWHFKDIHGQLKDKQQKDLALESWCKENGWRLIRIKEEIYHQDKEKWLGVLVDEVRNGKEKVVKFY